MMRLRREFFRKRNLIPLIFSLLLLSIFISQIDLHEFRSTITRSNPFFLSLAFVSHYLAYYFRGKRWQRIMNNEGFRGSGIDLAKIIFLFQAIDCILPAKVGDLYGAHLMKINYDLNRSYSLGTIFQWRIMDGMMIILVTSLGLLFWFRGWLPTFFGLFSWGRLLVASLVMVSLLGLYALFKDKIPRMIPSQTLRDILLSFCRGLRLEVTALPLLVFYTLLIWSLEVGRLFCICLSFGLVVKLVEVIFITFVVDLSTAMPLTPAGVGAVELVMTKLLEIIEIERIFIYPIVIVDRIIAYWSQIFLGALFFILAHRFNVRTWSFKGFPHGEA